MQAVDASAPLEPDPLPRVSTVEAVAAEVTTGIRAGRLVPGQRLVEQEFSRRLGVSRSSVREAFQRLAADGLLDAEPNRGVTVRQLSRAEVDNHFDVRGALEALAVRLATPRVAAAPDALRDLLEQMDAAVAGGQIPRYSDLNRRFHARLGEAAGNPQLARMLSRLGDSILGLQFRLMVDASDVLSTHDQHRALLAAMLAGDAARAEQVMAEHVEAARTLIQALPDSHFAPSPARGS